MAVTNQCFVCELRDGKEFYKIDLMLDVYSG